MDKTIDIFDTFKMHQDLFDNGELNTYSEPSLNYRLLEDNGILDDMDLDYKIMLDLPFY